MKGGLARPCFRSSLLCWCNISPHRSLVVLACCTRWLGSEGASERRTFLTAFPLLPTFLTSICAVQYLLVLLVLLIFSSFSSPACKRNEAHGLGASFLPPVSVSFLTSAAVRASASRPLWTLLSLTSPPPFSYLRTDSARVMDHDLRETHWAITPEGTGKRTADRRLFPPRSDPNIPGTAARPSRLLLNRREIARYESGAVTATNSARTLSGSTTRGVQEYDYFHFDLAVCYA
jgi:hypothetical protein